uniref:Uncharacterized protein n=1 Tax=Rhizophora mucronata TaxID=61149 RepID=A0A2P2M2T1_RHIMU
MVFDYIHIDLSVSIFSWGLTYADQTYFQ